jgi:hypothetical protein
MKLGIVIIDAFAQLITIVHEKVSVLKLVISIHSSVQSRNISVMDKLGMLCCMLKLCIDGVLILSPVTWPEFVLSQDNMLHDCDRF